MIKTKRLVISKATYDDIPSIILAFEDNSIRDCVEGLPKKINSLIIKQIINTGETFSIKINNILIGLITVYFKNYESRNLGYWIIKNYRNNGYATESVEAIIEYCFNHSDIKKIFATVKHKNTLSKSVLLKNNMVINKKCEKYTHYILKKNYVR